MTTMIILTIITMMSIVILCDLTWPWSGALERQDSSMQCWQDEAFGQV